MYYVLFCETCINKLNLNMLQLCVIGGFYNFTKHVVTDMKTQMFWVFFITLIR